MYIAPAYETDSGVILTYAVSIFIGSDSLYRQEQVVGNLFVPSILLSNLVWFPRNPCPTKQLIARDVTLGFLSGESLRLAYPFRPGTSNWFTFWQQLQSPEIVSIKGRGEERNDKYLRKSLGVL